MKRAAKAVASRYPILVLYRDILRAHQKFLPADARSLGDGYVKAEFRLHKTASPEFLSQFERTWRDYLTTLRVGDPENPGALGREMSASEMADLNDEQKLKLVEIYETSRTPSKDSK